MKIAPSIELTDQQGQTLEQWTRSHRIEKRRAFRATLIRAAGEGTESKRIAAELNTREATVSNWCNRFAERGIEGLQEAPRSGAPAPATRNRPPGAF